MALDGFNHTRMVGFVDKQTPPTKKRKNKHPYYKENVSSSLDEAEKQLNNTITHLKSKRSITSTHVWNFLFLEIRLL